MSYAGDIEPTDAFAALRSDPDAVIVDVRTKPELAFVGYPDVAGIGKQLVAIEWSSYPSGQQNPRFVDELAAHGIETHQPVYFLCRSGARSRAAAIAATAAGFETAFNIAHGFEGPPDPEGHRGGHAGWKAAGLPWRQQ